MNIIIDNHINKIQKAYAKRDNDRLPSEYNNLREVHQDIYRNYRIDKVVQASISKMVENGINEIFFEL